MGHKKIDYTSKDFDGFVASMLENIPDYLPEWTSRSPSDPGIVLIELFAHVADILSYYGDRIANEAFLSTATQRRSVLDIAEMLDYVPSGNQAASVDLTFTFAAADGSVTIPAHTVVSTASAEAAAAGGNPVEFTTNEAVTNSSLQMTVAATEGVRVLEEDIGTSDGTAGQEFLLLGRGVVDGSVVVRVDEGAGFETWRYIRHLLDAEANEKTFTLFTDEDEVVHVVFGDDANGRVPSIGAAIQADYRRGVGVRGNVGADTIIEMASPIAGVTSVTNVSTAAGGADPESTAEIKDNAPRSLRAIDRTVTLQDYADIAIRSGIVGKASAVASVYTQVTLYVAPRGNVGGTPVDAGKKDDLLDYLAPRTLVGTTVTLADPTYVPVNVTVAVEAWPTFPAGDVERGVTNTIAEMLSYSEAEFGTRVTKAEVFSRALEVAGVRYVDVTLLATGAGTGVTDVVMAANELPSEGTITVTVTGGVS